MQARGSMRTISSPPRLSHIMQILNENVNPLITWYFSRFHLRSILIDFDVEHSNKNGLNNLNN